jgi:hypothetical protein
MGMTAVLSSTAACRRSPAATVDPSLEKSPSEASLEEGTTFGALSVKQFFSVVKEGWRPVSLI